jgi:hypothetical protein
LHRTGKKSRSDRGKRPRSTVFTQQRLTPSGTACSALQAIVQAWQPMQRRRSIAKA